MMYQRNVSIAKNVKCEMESSWRKSQGIKEGGKEENLVFQTEKTNDVYLGQYVWFLPFQCDCITHF